MSVGVCNSRFLQCVPVIGKGHGRNLLEALYKQQQSGDLCDICLVISNERFSAHKAVLASFSAYFHALFESGQSTDATGSKACNVREIVLSSVEKSTFLPILHFIYTSQLHVFKENIGDILKTARKLQMPGIVEICNKLIESNMVLPSLRDINMSKTSLETDADSETRNNILYVDLSDCGEGDERAKTMFAGDQQTDKNPLGFENLPMTHSNGWPMRSHEITSSSLPPASSQSSSHSTEGLQTKSVSTGISHEEALVTASSGAISAYEPSRIQLAARPTKMVNRKILRNQPHFTCSHCGKVFSKKANLKRHVLIKHLKRHDFSCSKCGKTYAIEQSLQYHMSASRCSKTSLASIFDDFPPLSTTHSQPDLFDVSDSIDLPTLNSPIPCTTAEERNQEQPICSYASPGSSFLPQTMTPTSVDDSISPAMPPTSLFPSIAHLNEPATFGQLDNGAAEFFKFSQDSYVPVAQSTPTRDAENSDDDEMPTISRVQSMRDSVFDGPNQDFRGRRVVVEEDSDEMNKNPHTEIFKIDPETPSVAGEQAPNTPELISPMECTSSGNNQKSSQLADATSTVVCVAKDSGSIQNLIRLTPKTSLLMSLKKRSEPKTSNLKDVLPLLVPNRVDVSSLAGIFNIPKEGDAGGLRLAQASLPFHHLSNTSAVSASGMPTINTDCIRQTLHCPVCTAAFSSYDALVAHKRKCCKCPFCDRIFSQFSNMKRHVVIFHTKQKPHKCGVCGKAYGIKQSLRNHMQKKHGIPYIARKYNRSARSNKVDA